MTGTKIVHVPYKGGAPQTAALLAGQEPQFGFVSIGNVLPHIQSGKLRAIAVSNANRYKPLPGVPTIEESNLAGFNTAPWMALFVPLNTSKEIIQTINAESIKILLQTDVKDRLTQMGFELMTVTMHRVNPHEWPLGIIQATAFTVWLRDLIAWVTPWKICLLARSIITIPS
jgi:tripartite-type tricarboxylate transporter receptor subunit TctC